MKDQRSFVRRRMKSWSRCQVSRGSQRPHCFCQFTVLGKLGGRDGTYDVMSKCRSVYKPNYTPPCSVDKHIITLPKAKLAHNIIAQIPKPIRHIPLPCFLLISILALARENRAELSDVQQHHLFHAFQGIIAERLTQHSPLTSMQLLVNCIMRIPRSLDGGECGVEV